MKTANLEPDGNQAGSVTRGRKGKGRAGGDIRIIDAAGNDVVASTWRVTGATAQELDEDDGILAISGSGTTVDVEDYGAVHDGATDDTVSIQAAIDAAYAAGGGVIYSPPGEYIIGGALQDTGAFNGQLLLPDVPIAGVDHIVITFRGALRPGFHPVYGDTVPLAA